MQKALIFGCCLLVLAAALIFKLLWPAPKHQPKASRLNPSQPSSMPPDGQRTNSGLIQSNLLPTEQKGSSPLKQDPPGITQPDIGAFNHPIKSLPKVSAYQGSLGGLNWDELKQRLSPADYLSYLLALEQCRPFYRYARGDGHIHISAERLAQTEQNYQQKNYPAERFNKLKQRVNNCQGVPLTTLMQLNQQVKWVAEQGNLQAMLWLSYMPDLQLSLHPEVSRKRLQEFQQNQLNWLEQAAQRGSLTAVFNLAVRYENSHQPDIVNALAYFEILQQLQPEYQLTDKINALKQDLKTWQFREVATSKQILLQQLVALPELYE
ncbi:hypothetical protein [Gayadomonas joobiniege]|uniref:hypothetical protein n=1 Tax=Gayadomonas joobiniege TaxID=1234606 RepID=UPI0003618F0B|nr:hypothetical protein [Gayadomonas joobiniege]